MALLDGLYLTWNCGLRELNVFTNSLLAKLCVEQQVSPYHKYATLIRSIQDMLAHEWFVRLFHLHRKGNRSANRLAKKGREGSIRWKVWEVAPPERAFNGANLRAKPIARVCGGL